jgi:hypothetical protein
MKIKLLMMLLLSGFTITLTAQNMLFNGGFETWQDNGGYAEPQYWYTLNSLSVFGFEQTTTVTPEAKSGTYAAKLVTSENTMQNLPGLLASGPILNQDGDVDFSNIKVAFNYRPVSMSFFYRYMPALTDSCSAYMALTHWNDSTKQTDTLAEATFTIKDSVLEYNHAVINFQYYSAQTPDSAFVIITSSFNGFDPVPGSTLFIDDFKINFNTGLPTLNSTQANIVAYPNPVIDQLYIQANQPNVDLTISDVTGKKRIEKLAQSTQVPLDLKELEAGIYFLEVHTKTGVQIKKISKN